MNINENIYDPEVAQRLGQIGLNLAVETANKHYPNWSDRCWDAFKRWLNKKPPGFEFQIEDFRQDAEKWKVIEKPNSNRAYGFISKRAVKENLIDKIGMAYTDNKLAHGSPTGVWIKK